MAAILPKFERLSPRIIRVLGLNPGPLTLQGTNTYLIGQGTKRILIDAGEPGKPEYVKLLQSTLESHKIEIQEIIVTHWHADHVGGVPDICSTMSVKPRISKLKCLNREDMSLGAELDYTFIEDRSIFNTDGATLTAYHTPGHSEDHLILHCKEDGSVFSGDCILGEGTATFEDLYDYMKSLELIHSLKPTIIYPGHGPVITDAMNCIQMYIEHRKKREAQILATLAEYGEKPHSAMELVKIIYVDTPELLHVAAAKNVDHHLHKLYKEDKIVEVSEGLWSLKSPTLE